MKGPGIGDVTMAGGSGVFGTVMAAGVVSAMNSSVVVVGRRGNGRAGRNLEYKGDFIYYQIFRRLIRLLSSGSSGKRAGGGT